MRPPSFITTVLSPGGTKVTEYPSTVLRLAAGRDRRRGGGVRQEQHPFVDLTLAVEPGARLDLGIGDDAVLAAGQPGARRRERSPAAPSRRTGSYSEGG